MPVNNSPKINPLCTHCEIELSSMDHYITLQANFGGNKIYFHGRCFESTAGKKYIEMLQVTEEDLGRRKSELYNKMRALFTH